jgi:hypothetical protein
MPIPPGATEQSPDACVATTQQLLTNGNVDAAPIGVNWTQLPQNASYPPISTAAEMSATGITPQSGGNAVWLGGWATPSTDAIYQQITIPATTTSFHITGYRFYATAETAAGADVMRIQIRNTAGTVLETVKQWSNSDATTNWTFFDETVTGNYAGQTIRVYLESVLDNGENTNFFVDTLSVNVLACP